jgi:hypothetical protein
MIYATDLAVPTGPSTSPAQPPRPPGSAGHRFPRSHGPAKGSITGEWLTLGEDGPRAARQLSLAGGLADGGAGRNRQLEKNAARVDRAAFEWILAPTMPPW